MSKKPRYNDPIRAKCKELGISEAAYWGRRRNGWTKEEALTMPRVGAIHLHEGIPVKRLLPKTRYIEYIKVRKEGFSEEEAWAYATRKVQRYKYSREGMSLWAWCHLHGVSYQIELNKVRREIANANKS